MLELQTKDCGKEVVFAGIEAAILFKREKTITVPVVPRSIGFTARKIERRRSVERRNLAVLMFSTCICQLPAWVVE